MSVIQSTFDMLGLLIDTEKSILSQKNRVDRSGLGLCGRKAFVPQIRFQTMLAIALDLKAQPTRQHRLASFCWGIWPHALK